MWVNSGGGGRITSERESWGSIKSSQTMTETISYTVTLRPRWPASYMELIPTYYGSKTITRVTWIYIILKRGKCGNNSWHSFLHKKYYGAADPKVLFGKIISKGMATDRKWKWRRLLCSLILSNTMSWNEFGLLIILDPTFCWWKYLYLAFYFLEFNAASVWHNFRS